MDSVKQAVENVVGNVAETLQKTSLGRGADKKSLPSSKKEKKANKKTKDAAAAATEFGPLELDPPPAFLQHRLEIFNRLKKKADEELAKKPRDPIIITKPDGSVTEGRAWETTPGDIARGIANTLYKRAVVAQLDGDVLWDLDRPLERSCSMKLLTFDDSLGKEVFWHSSAHILGEACERRFGCSLCIGPPIDGGFYYEMALPDGGAVHEADWKPIETIVTSIVKEGQKFERLELSKDDLLEMFSYNKYKVHIIKDKIPDGTYTTVYRNGPLIDLCRGPHVPDTSRVEAFSVMNNSASYFLGNQENDSLQRVYGLSFPDKKRMTEHKKFLEEAAKRDHRNIGRDQELFFTHELSPGSTMWLPHGMRVVNTLMAYIKEQYWKRGYQEVATPNMYNAELWKMSGHWSHYKDNMFVIEGIENAKFGLKPMNCPGHCLIFSHRERSHRELPWRVADFGVLHRNEASGALTGLTRVRRFQQDDAHIFCREDQIKDEIGDLFDFLREMYGLLGFTYKLRLSTRPDSYMGELETWNRAEDILRQALDDFSSQPGGVPWTLNPGDGAFYGPKIDIKIFDCLGRDWQCATIQLDFVQPVNFSLEYVTAGVGMLKEDRPAVAEGKEEAATPEGQAGPGNPLKLKAKDPEVVTASAVAARVASAGVPAEGATAPAGGEENSDDKESKKPVFKPLTPGCARPVMIHRAMAGSIERFMAMLIENYAGKWPFWLSPRQIIVIPVGKGFADYAEEVRVAFHNAKLYVDVDLSGNTLQKKVRSAQLAQYNFIFVVGHEEQQGRQVNVRNRDDPATQDRGTPIAVDEALEKLSKLKAERASYNPFPSDRPAKEVAQEVKA